MVATKNVEYKQSVQGITFTPTANQPYKALNHKSAHFPPSPNPPVAPTNLGTQGGFHRGEVLLQTENHLVLGVKGRHHGGQALVVEFRLHVAHVLLEGVAWGVERGGGGEIFGWKDSENKEEAAMKLATTSPALALRVVICSSLAITSSSLVRRISRTTFESIRRKDERRGKRRVV